MKGEIKDEPNWYCQQKAETPFCNNKTCKYRHRKYPTPEQFKEEYGEEYPDDGAVYELDNNQWPIDQKWIVTAKKYCGRNSIIR